MTFSENFNNFDCGLEDMERIRFKEIHVSKDCDSTLDKQVKGKVL